MKSHQKPNPATSIKVHIDHSLSRLKDTILAPAKVERANHILSTTVLPK